MKYLIEQAARVNVTIEAGELPTGERARYIPPTAGRRGRIIVSSSLCVNEARRVGLMALGHAYNGDTQPSVAATEAASLRGLELVLESVEHEVAHSPANTGVLPIVQDARATLEAGGPISSILRRPAMYVASAAVFGAMLVEHMLSLAETSGMLTVA